MGVRQRRFCEHTDLVAIQNKFLKHWKRPPSEVGDTVDSKVKKVQPIVHTAIIELREIVSSEIKMYQGGQGIAGREFGEVAVL